MPDLLETLGTDPAQGPGSTVLCAQVEQAPRSQSGLWPVLLTGRLVWVLTGTSRDLHSLSCGVAPASPQAPGTRVEGPAVLASPGLGWDVGSRMLAGGGGQDGRSPGCSVTRVLRRGNWSRRGDPDGSEWRWVRAGGVWPRVCGLQGERERWDPGTGRGLPGACPQPPCHLPPSCPPEPGPQAAPPGGGGS